MSFPRTPSLSGYWRGSFKRISFKVVRSSARIWRIIPFGSACFPGSSSASAIGFERSFTGGGRHRRRGIETSLRRVAMQVKLGHLGSRKEARKGGSPISLFGLMLALDISEKGVQGGFNGGVGRVGLDQLG